MLPSASENPPRETGGETSPRAFTTGALPTSGPAALSTFTRPLPDEQHVVSLASPGLPEQETDICLVPYAARQMVPSFVLCLAITALGLAYLWFEPAVAWPWFISVHPLVLHVVLGGLWVFQLFRFGYRKACTFIRLTTRRVFWNRGFLYGKGEVIPFSQVVRVEPTWNPINHLLAVGDVTLVRDGPSAAPVTLLGVPHPGEFVATLRQLVEKARQEKVTATRVTLQSGVIEALSGP